MERVCNKLIFDGLSIIFGLIPHLTASVKGKTRNIKSNLGGVHVELKNYMEDLVFQRLDHLIGADSKVCKCEKCRYDVAALALNFLPPRYVVTDKGETYARVKSLEQQFNVDIITAITHAIKIVSSQPHHDNAE